MEVKLHNDSIRYYDCLWAYRLGFNMEIQGDCLKWSLAMM